MWIYIICDSVSPIKIHISDISVKIINMIHSCYIKTYLQYFRTLILNPHLLNAEMEYPVWHSAGTSVAFSSLRSEKKLSGVSSVTYFLCHRLWRTWARYWKQVVLAILQLWRQQSCKHMFFTWVKGLLFYSRYFDLSRCDSILFTRRLADLQDFKKVNEVYGKCMFELCYPSFPSAVIPFFNHGAVRVLSFRLPSSDSRCHILVFSFLWRYCVLAADFPAPAPARSTYQVAALPLNARIEIECIAAL